MIRPCQQYLGFDDRRLMLISIPVLSMIMPFMLNMGTDSWSEYWLHGVPESLFFTIGFWTFYRTLIIALRKKYRRFEEITKRIIIQSVIILLSAPVLKMIFGLAIYWILSFFNIEEHKMPDYVISLFSIYLPSGMIVAVYEAMYFFSQYKTSIVEKEKMQTTHIQTQLDSLRNQINPHFLFNSLNTLMNLIPGEPELAMNFLSKLSKFYRYSVGNQEDKTILLDKEIECAKLYADLLQVRFGKGIEFEFEKMEKTAFYILPMSLQLLIENAVKHNIVSSSQPLKLKLSIDYVNEYLTVSNNLQEKIESMKSTGMGLENIKSRFGYFTDREVIIESNGDEFKVGLPLIKHHEGINS